MNIQLNIKRKSFLPVYLPYVKDYKNRYEVYYGGAGSGKSVFIAQKLLIKACSSKRKILVIRKYGTSVRDSVYQLIIDMLKKWGLYNYCKINQSIFNDPSFQESFCPNKFIFLFEKSPTISSRFNLLNKFVEYYTKQINDIKNENKVLLDKLNVINKQRRNFKEQQKNLYHHSKSNSCLIQSEANCLAKTSLEIKDLDDKMKPYLREILTQMKSKINFLIEENKTFKEYITKSWS